MESTRIYYHIGGCMKKLVLCSLFLVLSVAAFSQIAVSAGGQVGYAMSSMTDNIDVDADNFAHLSQTDNILGFGAFVDATYVRLNLEYAMALNATRTLEWVAGGVTLFDETADSPDGYSVNWFNIVLLGKYPIALGAVKVWPTAGIMYSMLLSMDSDGDGTADDLTDADMNDIYLVGGVGLDFDLTKQLFLTGSALFNYNLTPITVVDYELADDESWTTWQLAVRLGVGFKF
jgi:hypothetical protein